MAYNSDNWCPEIIAQTLRIREPITLKEESLPALKYIQQPSAKGKVNDTKNKDHTDIQKKTHQVIICFISLKGTSQTSQQQN